MPIAVSVTVLVVAFAMSYFYPIFDAGLTGLGRFIGGAGALRCIRLRLRQPDADSVGLHHILNSYVWFIMAASRLPTAVWSPVN